MRYFVYIIRSGKDGRLYKGMNSDISSSLINHNSGKVRSTKDYRPWKLVYHEEHSTFQEARAREKFLKTGDGRDLVKSLNL